jgi:hypothetical protein
MHGWEFDYAQHPIVMELLCYNLSDTEGGARSKIYNDLMLFKSDLQDLFSFHGGVDGYFNHLLQTPEVRLQLYLLLQMILILSSCYMRLLDIEGVVHILVSVEVASKRADIVSLPERICSIDSNPNGFAAAIVSRKDGNPLAHRFFRNDKLIYASQNKRDNAIGEIVREIIKWAENKFNATSFAIEDLNIKNNQSFGRKVNRIIYNFVRKKFVETLLIKCWKLGRAEFSVHPKSHDVYTVNPAYTSQIGLRKYKDRFGLSIHESAAFCIGRRYYGFGEELPLDEPIAITVKRNKKPRERVPVHYVWASLYGYAMPRDQYIEPPRRKGSNGKNLAMQDHLAAFTGHPA